MNEERNESIRIIQEKVFNMELAHLYPRNFPIQIESVNAEVMRARKAVAKSKCYSAVVKWVPKDYYTFSLPRRMDILNAGSTFQLCKSMLMENKMFDPKINISNDDATYSQFYLIVLQYEAAINNKKLCSEVRGLRPVSDRLDTSKFDFRVASEEDNARLTGFSHNAVSPFGLVVNVPIILSKAIVDDLNMKQFIWMGGGHVQCKIGVAVTDFISTMSPIVLDISDSRQN